MKQHGGNRQGSGRKALRHSGSTRLYVPNELLQQVKAMIKAHDVKASIKPIESECGCEVIGHTAAGRAIVRKCIKHR